MKLEMKSLTVEGEKISGVLEFVGELSKIENDSYSARSLVGTITDKIAHDVSSIIIKTRSGEILKQVDIEEVIKRIQLNVVDNLLNRR